MQDSPGQETMSRPDDYGASAITILEGLEAVRERPGMYIGDTGDGGFHRLIWEIFDNSVDEAMNGHATRIEVGLHRDGSVSVADDGRGIPVDPHEPSGKPALEVILTKLHAGGKFDSGAYRSAGGLHGVGASVVNALSARLTAQVRRGRRTWEMAFRRGRRISGLRDVGPAVGAGSTIRFLPDPEKFGDRKPDRKRIARHLRDASYLHPGLSITLFDEADGSRETWRHDGGLSDYLAEVIRREKLSMAHEGTYAQQVDPLGEGGRLELALGWTASAKERVRSYVNGIRTRTGGSHEAGFREGLTKAVRGYLDTHALTPRGLTVAAGDIREGMVAILSVFIPNPQFEGQTKGKLYNPELRAPVDAAVRAGLERWLHESPTAAERIAGRVLLAARSREASRAATLKVRKRAEARRRTVLPGKLSDCALRDSRQTEIFIVEGDSAGGSAKQGRDRTRQAVLPLRGKILNAAQAPEAKVAKNAELSSIALALGCGAGAGCDPSLLRYRRVVLLADADADGHHITTLLLAYFVKFFWKLLEDGRIFIARPPLYRVEIGKMTHWAADEAARDAILRRFDGRKPPVITRFKGLGEMPPKVLWETTLNPETRSLLEVRIRDRRRADAFIHRLMGRDPAARRRLIRRGAPDPAALDL